jgi:hypothetical protein
LRYRSIYLTLQSALFEKQPARKSAPDGADDAALGDTPGDRESLLNLAPGAGGDGLLDENRGAGEEVQDLHLDVLAWVGGAAVHGWTADDDGAREKVVAGALLLLPFRLHAPDIILECGIDACGLVRGFDGGVAFLLQGCARAVGRGVNDGDDFESGAEFAANDVCV